MIRFLLLLLFCMSPALAQAQLQFDKTLLQANGIGSQKLEDALNDNKLYPNENSVSLYVNDHSFGQDHVFLFPNGAVGFDQATLERIGLKIRPSPRHGCMTVRPTPCSPHPLPESSVVVIAACA